MASLDQPGYPLSVSTGVDGRMRISDGVNDRTVAASMTAGLGQRHRRGEEQCGGGTQILVTSAGDDTTTDSLRAFEVPDREPVQVSAALDFPVR